jgi:DNA helicase II / ATP-dependent DNA helicase PcrA
MTTFQPRPKQLEMLTYRGGKMGVSAVPGSGKTHTLSFLAAQIIAGGELEDDQEVLIVTLVNSAVNNFSERVAGFIRERNLLPNLNYRVRTLHGLAHDIVRERPGLVNLANDFQIIDERAADQICAQAAQAWLQGNPHVLDEFLDASLEQGKLDWLRREKMPGLVTSLAQSFIHLAKDLQITPDKLSRQLESLPLPLPLAELGCAIYHDYQRALAYRGAVDFDDLTRLALQALQLDEQYLEQLRYRWPYVLEDEAQDSSRLQEEILNLLSGPEANWVRVGDPNQAIFETFTTANPRFLRDFLAREDVYARELPDSGRSTHSIIRLANYLTEWTRSQHPQEEAREALAPPSIQPTPPGDAQGNPKDEPGAIQLVSNGFSPQDETHWVVESIANWLPQNSENTVAVLVPRNTRGSAVAEELKRHNLEFVELLKSSASTRATAGALTHILRYLADPGSARKLETAYRVWRRSAGRNGANKEFISQSVTLLKKCRRVEEYLWPQPGDDWLNSELINAQNEGVRTELAEFRQRVQEWHALALLPVDQVILSLAQDLFQEVSELALAHKLALILRRAGDLHRDWRLPQLADELAAIAKNQRRFLGFSSDDLGIEPDRYKGKVFVTTIHKAKGLEWDRVYLMSVNNYDFPSGLASDRYIAEKDFVRDGLNLEAEALAQLQAAFSTDEYSWYIEREATRQARIDYIGERLRLLFVGITRAKKELVVTWNTGRRGDCYPAVPFTALMTYWEEAIHDPSG